MAQNAASRAWKKMARGWTYENRVLRITGLSNVTILKRMATDAQYKDAEVLVLDRPTSTAYYKYVRNFQMLRALRLENFSPLQSFDPPPEEARAIPKVTLAHVNMLDGPFTELLSYLGTTELELIGIGEVKEAFWNSLYKMGRLTSLSVRSVELGYRFFRNYLPNMGGLRTLSLSAFCSNSGALSSLNLTRLTELAELELSNVGLQSLPTGFHTLEHLRELRITNVPLSRLAEESSGEGGGQRGSQEAANDVLQRLRGLDISGSGLKTLPSLQEPIPLERLIAKNTAVKRLPKCYYTPSLEVLDLSGSALEALDKTGFGQLGSLRELDLSFTQLRELPGGQEGPGALEKLNLRGLSELRQLPEWLSGCTRLKELNLGQLHLDEFPSQLLLQRDFRICNQVDGGWEDKEDSLCRILIGGLRQSTIDPQLLLTNDPTLLRCYVEAADKRPISRGSLFFLGDPDAGKGALAQRVTDVPLSEWKQLCGMRILDDALVYENIFLGSGAPRERWPARMSGVRVVEMSGYDAARFLHPFFLTNHALYVIVLRDGEDVQRRALYWSKLVEAYAPNGHIILVVCYDKVIHHRIDLSLLRLSVWMDRSPEVIYLDRSGEDQERQRELNEMIVNGLQSLMLNTLCLPESWIRLLSHLEQLLETRMLMPWSMYEQLAENYLPKMESAVSREILKRYLLAFEAETLGQMARVPEGQDNMLYHTDWLSEGLYLLTWHLYQEGKSTAEVEDIWEFLIDNSQHSYSRAQVKILLEFCAARDLCVGPSWNTGEYLFPSVVSEQEERSQVRAAFSSAAEQLRSNPEAEHYIIRCPLFSSMMFTQLLVRTFRAEDKGALDGRKVIMGQTELFLRYTDGRMMLILGETGAPAELHLYFSGPGDLDEQAEADWHQSVLGQFRAVLETLPEHLTQRYQISVERTFGRLNDPRFARRAEISLDDLAGCRRAGYGSYFCGKLNHSYQLRDFPGIR